MNVKKKGKDYKEAFKCTIKTTLKNGVHSYGIAFGGSLLGDMIQNNPNKFIQSVGNSSVPTMIVGGSVVNCKVLIDYFRGKRREIDRVECLEKLGRENITFLSGIAMGSIGQLAIPIPVVGALVGGFVGAILSETCFNAFLKARE